MFSLELDGEPGDLEDLFPDWNRHDRFGIVVDEPYGAVGASLLIQAAIALFYDVRPARRGQQYPETYVFQVGRPRGDHSAFDFYPPRKQVVVESAANSVLAAINDRAITRLAVPDGSPVPADVDWRELGAASDRISSVFAYSCSGRVTDPDILIAGTGPGIEDNTRMTLQSDTWPRTVLAMSNEELIDFESHVAEGDVAHTVLRYCKVLARYGDDDIPAIARGWAKDVAARISEVSPQARREAVERRRASLTNGLPSESYRRIGLDDGVGLLARPAAA